MTFRVGQKVVAVGGHKNSSHLINPPSDANLPKIGCVYTIRNINIWPAVTLLLLQEIDNGHLLNRGYGPIEPGFNAAGFRPVVERKTDISVFTEILRKATKPARTPAMSQQERQS